MFVVKYGSQSFLLSIFSNQRVLLTQQKCQTRIRLIIFMCMIWPLLEKKLAIIGSTSPPGPRGSPLSSMPFRSNERGTRVKDRAKNGASKRAGKGWGRKKKESFLSLPLPSLSFFSSRFISRAVKTENLPRSFFAPKPNGNACYAGYRLRLDKACIRIVSLSVAFGDRKRTVP